jgi:leucyl aminopeptidase
LIDAPANHKTPEFLGHWAKDSAVDSNYKCTVLHQKELIEQKFDAVLAVGKGSVHPPVVIINEYLPKKGKGVDIGLVGKGITFDSGGVSIKPSQNLHYMKSDMGGSAVVLGVVEVAARLKLNINIVSVVASAENAVDAASYRPGDVINSHSGKTIEIIDTDAEGRLVMADAISFIIKKYQPEQLIDLATLTGSVVRTLGYAAAGMFTPSNEMADRMSKVGEDVHERVWRLPLYDDFESDLHSDIADIRNFSGKPIGGAINAAKFLESFTESHEKWMHLDIAGVAFGDSNYSKMKSASGYGVQLLTSYIKSLI